MFQTPMCSSSDSYVDKNKIKVLLARVEKWVLGHQNVLPFCQYRGAQKCMELNSNSNRQHSQFQGLYFVKIKCK